jgi:DNA (cytosine-5)-methyltransferase 1
MGLYQAGFEVVGVDIKPQPSYPFKFVQHDATEEEDFSEYDLVWASPPCQAFTAYRRRKGHVRPYKTLIPKVRKILQANGVPYIIENVPGAPLIDPVMLCGSMFGLDVRRHRFFEWSFWVDRPECRHDLQLPRFPSATNRKNLRKTVEVGAWRIPLETQRRAMGIDWMTVKELSQAIPPAYSRYLAEGLLFLKG